MESFFFELRVSAFGCFFFSRSLYNPTIPHYGCCITKRIFNLFIQITCTVDAD